VSTGSLPYRASLAAAVAAAEAVRDGSSLPASIPYPEVQQLLTRTPSGRTDPKEQVRAHSRLGAADVHIVDLSLTS
jgi:hypothetical protein